MSQRHVTAGRWPGRVRASWSAARGSSRRHRPDRLTGPRPCRAGRREGPNREDAVTSRSGRCRESRSVRSRPLRHGERRAVCTESGISTPAAARLLACRRRSRGRLTARGRLLDHLGRDLLDASLVNAGPAAAVPSEPRTRGTGMRRASGSDAVRFICSFEAAPRGRAYRGPPAAPRLTRNGPWAMRQSPAYRTPTWARRPSICRMIVSVCACGTSGLSSSPSARQRWNSIASWA